MNIDILGISEIKWTGMGEFNSDGYYIYYCGQESLRRNGIALIVNQRVQNAVFGCNLKNYRMISIHFQGKPFIRVIQIYALTTDGKEAEVDKFYEDLEELLELTPKNKKRKKRKRYSVHHWELECKSRKSRDIWSNGQVWPWNTK